MEYDAFISYSRAASGPLASAVQAELQRPRLGRVRSDRSFRDETDLFFNPYRSGAWSQRVRMRAEWRALVTAMDTSRWFVLLASTEAAQSYPVNREVEYWLDTKSINRLAVVTTSADEPQITGATLVAHSVLPPVLRSRVEELPFVVTVDGDIDRREGRRKLRRAMRPIAAAVYDTASR